MAVKQAMFLKWGWRWPIMVLKDLGMLSCMSKKWWRYWIRNSIIVSKRCPTSDCRRCSGKDARARTFIGSIPRALVVLRVVRLEDTWLFFCRTIAASEAMGHTATNIVHWKLSCMNHAILDGFYSCIANLNSTRWIWNCSKAVSAFSFEAHVQ